MEERSKEQPTGSHSEVEQRAQAATEAAKREAHQLTEEAKHKLDSEVSARKGMIAKELGHLGKALESSAQEPSTAPTDRRSARLDAASR